MRITGREGRGIPGLRITGRAGGAAPGAVSMSSMVDSSCWEQPGALSHHLVLLGLLTHFLFLKPTARPARGAALPTPRAPRAPLFPAFSRRTSHKTLGVTLALLFPGVQRAAGARSQELFREGTATALGCLGCARCAPGTGESPLPFGIFGKFAALAGA